MNFYGRKDTLEWPPFVHTTVEDLLISSPDYIAQCLEERQDFALVSFGATVQELAEEFPSLAPYPRALAQQLEKVKVLYVS